MEKKTIGGFIAALRKANGMTQKDLADRLNVSDKTVSRWERDDGAPDLSVIPVIAEIFNVTCDELLRGERKPPEARAETQSEEESTAKGERERKRLLKLSLTKFKSRTYISLGISAAGLIAALICNFAFLRANLGFFTGLAFFAASIVCQAVFTNRALFAADDDGPDTPEKASYRRSAMTLTRNTLAVTVGLCGFTAPMLLVGAYEGLSGMSQLTLGALYAAIVLAAYAVIWYFVGARLIKKSIIAMDERENAVYRHNHRLKGICAGVLAALAAVTAAVHIPCISTDLLMKGTEFTDVDSFAEFMERDVPDSGSGQYTDNQVVAPAPESSFDENGQEISDDEFFRHEICDSDGNVIRTFIWRNRDVYRIKYATSVGPGLPITVYTNDDYHNAYRAAFRNNLIFIAIYALETVAVAAVYLKKRQK